MLLTTASIEETSNDLLDNRKVDLQVRLFTDLCGAMEYALTKTLILDNISFYQSFLWYEFMGKSFYFILTLQIDK